METKRGEEGRRERAGVEIEGESILIFNKYIMLSGMIEDKGLIFLSVS